MLRRTAGFPQALQRIRLKITRFEFVTFAAMHHQTPKEALEYIFEKYSSDEYILESLASNPQLANEDEITRQIIAKLKEHEDSSVVDALYSNWFLPRTYLREKLNNNDIGQNQKSQLSWLFWLRFGQDAQ